MAAPAAEHGERQPCPLGVCDGSGWILGPEDVARPCECRARMVAQARLRGVASVIPPKYRGVSFDRPPVTEMDAERGQARCATTASDLDENLDARPRPVALSAAPAPARRRWRCWSRRTALEAGPLGRDLLAAEAARPGSAAPTTPRPASSPTRSSSSGWPPSTCSTSTTSAPRSSTEWVLEQLYALVNERYERQRSMVVTTNLEDDELEEQIGTRAVSRLVEICGDPRAALRRGPAHAGLRGRRELARRGRRLGARPPRPLARPAGAGPEPLIIPWSCLESS